MPMSSVRNPRPSRLMALAAAVTLTASLAGCGHPDPQYSMGGGQAPTSPVAKTQAGASTEEPGTFGDMGKVCQPGTPKPADARGVSAKEIKIGVLNDAGNTVVPGLGQQYIDVGKAFADWCNKAGGINGRKIVINNRDTQLFNAAAAVLNACQSDFMLVGGGSAFDAPTVEPREECGLGAIPSSTPAYESQTGKQQAVIGRTSKTSSNIGLFRLLQPDNKEALNKIGILAIDTPDLKIPYVRLQKALDQSGMKVVSFQAGPPSLDNVRTYVQPLVGRAEALVLPVSLIEIFRAINDVGYKPKMIIDQGSLFYNLDTVESFQKVPLNAPLYSAATSYPLDLADKNPTATKLVELEKEYFGEVDQSHMSPWITWLLFASSASKCDVLSVDCVIKNAQADKAFTAGGLMAPIDLSDPTKLQPCIQISRVSKDGIVYDEKLTAPTDGVFNCDPKNIVNIKGS